MTILFSSTGIVLADLDVNAVAGVALIEGSPAPAGTLIRVQTTSYSTTTAVDGPNVPPFQRGQGKFDTGDVPQFNTGENVVVSFQNGGIKGQSSKNLNAGTTTVNLNGNYNNPPTISGVPDQSGTEDVSWELDLDPYISDPDTPTLEVSENSNYVSVDGYILTFLYPDGITSETVTITVRDGSSSDIDIINVNIDPVNDPPVIMPIPLISLMEGSGTQIDLSLYLEDPDDSFESIVWTHDDGGLEVSVEDSMLSIWAPEGGLGLATINLVATDPGGLYDEEDIQVEVGANLTFLIEFYTTQIEDLNGIIDDLREENDDLRSEVDDLSSEVSQLENDNSILQDQLADAGAEIERLLAQINEIGSGGGNQTEEIITLISEKATLSARIAELEAELASAIAEYEEIISDLNATILEYENQILALEGELSSMEARISSLAENATETDDIVANLTQEKIELQQALDDRKQDLLDLESLTGNLESQIIDLTRLKNEAESALDEMETSLQEMQSENTDLRSRLSELENLSPAFNVSPNTTEGNKTLQGDLFGRVARIARNGAELVISGMDNSLFLLILGLIAVSSGVTIAARTSWLQMGSGKSSSSDFWQTIENRTVNDTFQGIAAGVSGSSTVSRTSPSATSNTNKTKKKSSANQQSGKSQMMLRRKPTPPVKEKRKIVVSTKPVSLERKNPKMARALERLVDNSEKPKEKEQRVEEKPIKKVPPEPEEKSMPLKEDNQASTAIPSKEETKAADDLDNLSRVDREYIKTLIELGYTKEAEAELRNRSKK